MVSKLANPALLLELESMISRATEPPYNVQIPTYFWYSHLYGVAFLMKQDDVSDIVEIGLLGFATEMPKADGLVQAIEEFGGLRHFHDGTCGITPPKRVLSRSCLTTPSKGELYCRCGLINS